MSNDLWQLHFDKAQLAFHVSQFWLYGNEYYLSQMICLWTEFLQSKTFFISRHFQHSTKFDIEIHDEKYIFILDQSSRKSCLSL